MRLTLVVKIFLGINILLFSCKKDDVDETQASTQTQTSTVSDSIVRFLHISHTRTNEVYEVYSKVKNIDYSKYSMLLLGGDLTGQTSSADSIMSNVSSLYNLGSNNTLWSLGNHDYSNLQLINYYTNRPAYYACYNNGITFVVLDTQDSLSNIVGAQLEFFNNVMDTIVSSSHLIILHHKLIWMYGNSELEPQIETVANGWLGSCFYCINPNNFYQDIYPKLVNVKSKGVNVICLGGDIGFFSKKFEYLTTDSIYFIASGMWYDDVENYGLVFSHNITNKELTWEYKLVDDL